MKKILLVILFVLSAGTITLTYQWLSFSENSMNTESAFASSVVITARGQELHIEQTFFRYSPGNYNLELPKEATNVLCNDEPCQDRGTIDFEEEAPVISFDLPLSEKTGAWAARVKGHGTEFEVELRDTSYQNRSFTMVTSPDASVEKERLHYYKWNGISVDDPLYTFQLKEKQRYANEALTILHEPDKLLDQSFLNDATSFTEEYGSYLLFLDEQENSFSDHSIFLKNRNQETLEQLLFRKKTAEKTSGEEHWVNRMYAALFFETSMERAENLAAPISSTLTSEEKSELKERFLNMDSSSDPVSFSDKVLSALREGESNYSEMVDTQGEARFYYLIPRVSDEGGEFTFVDYLNDTYIPLGALKEDESFEVVMLEENSFILETGEDRYRLTLDSETFVQNESSFGIAAGAVNRFEDKLYIKETFLNEVLELYLGNPDS